MAPKKELGNKAAEVEKERKKIRKLYKDLPEDRKNLAENLVDRVAFMAVSLRDMEAQINEEGKTQEMPQGDYTIQRAHPLLASYNAMIKNYTTAIKQLDSFITGAGGGLAKPGAQLLGWLGSGGGQGKK